MRYRKAPFVLGNGEGRGLEKESAAVDVEHDAPEVQAQEIIVASKMTALDPRHEMLEANIMATRGVMPWGDDLIEAANAVNAWKRAGTVGGPDNPIRTSDFLRVSEQTDARLALYERLFCQIVGIILNQWYRENPYAMTGPLGQVKDDEGYDLLRYRKGQFYGVHSDTGAHNPPHIARRRISVVAFPTAECEGGALRFPRQKLKIEPEPGLVVSFPSDPAFVHESMPVKSGTKYSLVTWLF